MAQPQHEQPPAEVLSLGVERGGCEIMGREEPEGWQFWLTGTSMDLNPDDNETWSSFEAHPTPSLAEALPEVWWMMWPVRNLAKFKERIRTE